ncbi:hypothetical protein BsWGS_04858 [Bradybaena similaris]
MSDGVQRERPGLRPEEFALSWRVQPEASIYAGYCGRSRLQSPSAVWCQCVPEYRTSCRIHGELTPCSRDSDNFNYWKGQDITSDLSSISMKPNCGADRKIFEYNRDQTAGISPWPTASNITEEMARDVCTQTILNSTQGAACANIIPETFNSTVDSCVLQAQVSDDLSWAQSALSLVISVCRITTFTDLTFWVNSTGHWTPDLSFINTLCFSQCSQHGTCKEGTCVCADGYGLADCSVELSVPPAIISLANDGLCDITQSRCKAVAVTGITFVLSKSLVCKLQRVKIGQQEMTEDGDAILVAADYISFSEITCPLPVVGSYKLQISNNNNTFSEVSVFTVFHPQCHKCNTSGYCSLTFESCFIDNNCYMYGQENLQNGSLVCDNYQSYDKWSPRKDYPYVRGKPLVTTNYNTTTQEFHFLCEFFVNERDGVDYFVEWLHNTQFLLRGSVDEFGQNSTSVSLNVRDIPGFTFRSNVTCRLSACFAENCNTTTSPPENSNVFTADVKIVRRKVTITEGLEPGYIEVQSSVPPEFLCAGDDLLECHVFVSVGFVASRELTCPNSAVQIPQLVFQFTDTSDSSVRVCGLEYIHWPSPLPVPLEAVLDSLVDGDQTRQVAVNVMLEYNQTVQLSEPIGIQEVTVVDRDSSSLCRSLNDPHMLTFDHRAYNIYKEGEYILLKHAALPYEVHTFYRKCNGNRAACNCAVTVKSGDDIILFDRCGTVSSGKTPHLKIQVYLNGNLTANTHIIQELEGRKYRVILPTGTEVKVVVTPKFLNVWVQSSAADFNSIMGLCGNFNNNASDDLKMPSGTVYTGNQKEPDAFSLSWRVNATESHFRGICASDSAPASRTQYCVCSNDGSPSVCQPSLKVSLCLPSGDAPKRIGQGKDVTAYFLRSSLSSLGCSPDTHFQYDSNYTSPSVDWPTSSNWTLETATKFCQNYLVSKSLSVRCNDTVSFDFTSTVEACVSDIQLMDDTSYSVEALSSVVEQCLSKVTRTVTSWVGRKPDVSVLDLMCLNDCNARGNCSQGICVCQKNFAGVDCSVNLTAPPSCNIFPHQFCDVDQEDCTTVTVTGGPFVDSPDLACLFQKIDYQFSEDETTSSTTVVKATFISYEIIVCTLPFLASFNISVRNLATINSATVARLVYSLQCFQCDSATCHIKPKYCFINNTCYRVADASPLNPDLVCEPQRNISQWTDRNDFPRLTAKLDLQADFDVNASLFEFICDWAGFENNNTDLTILSQWFIDDELLSETVVAGNTSRAKISHTQLTGLVYDSKVYCGLVACVTSNCNQTRSPVVKSQNFRFEIKVLGTTRLEVTEGSDDKAVRLTSNFPPAVFCDLSSGNDSRPCQILITLQVPVNVRDIRCPVTNQTLPQLAVRWLDESPRSSSSCAVTLTNTNWNRIQTILVRAVADGKIDGDQERSIIISAQLSQTLIVAVQTVKVTVVDADYVAICQSINDPHMTTFDGLLYNNFNVGEFVLYRHTTLLYEVRTFYRKCYGRAVSCNCALVARAGDDIVRIDRCGPAIGDYRRRTPLKVQMFLNGNMTQGLKVARYNDGKKYEVRQLSAQTCQR